jgi:hypothetical protein
MRYCHTQIGWVSLIGMGGGMVLTLVLMLGSDKLAVAAWIAPAIAVTFLLFMAVFGRLTTMITGDEFIARFGWLGWPSQVTPLAEIAGAIPTRTAPISGWGIRITTRGWLYNVSGRDAVIIGTTDGKQYLVGTDEPVALADAINAALGREPEFSRIRGAGVPQE